MEKYDKFFLDVGNGHLSKTIFSSVNYLSSARVEENLSYLPFTLPRKTCHGEIASVYSRQFFLYKWTCQGKLAGVNEAQDFRHSSTEMCASRSAWVP